MLNTVIFGGRLAAEPIMRYTTDGRAVANMLIINSRTSGFGTDNEREYSDQMSVVAFDNKNEDAFQLATWCAENLRTGDEVTADGRIQSGEYRQGDKLIRTTEAVATFIHRHTSDAEADRLQANRIERYAAEEAAQQKQEEERVAALVTA